MDEVKIFIINFGKCCSCRSQSRLKHTTKRVNEVKGKDHCLTLAKGH